MEGSPVYISRLLQNVETALWAYFKAFCLRYILISHTSTNFRKTKNYYFLLILSGISIIFYTNGKLIELYF